MSTQKELPLFDDRRKKVPVPRDYSLGPIFAATRQTTHREVPIGDDRLYQIGGFHPLKPGFKPPAIDVRHARAIYTLLSFRKPAEEGRTISFSMNEFCRRFSRSSGGRYSKEVATLLGDLMDSYIRVTDIETGIKRTYRMIERVEIEELPARKGKGDEKWVRGATLSPEFAEMMSIITELQSVKLDVFTAIRSPIAQAIYLYLPSRASHHPKEDPFEISLSRILEQVGASVPAKKSLRKQLFTQNNNSILKQLDGLETLTGKFRCRLAEMADDWKLQCWVEKIPAKPAGQGIANSKLCQAYLASGKTMASLQERLKKRSELTSYELEMLMKANIAVEPNRRFLELAKSVLGEDAFQSLLSEAKGDELEGRGAKIPAARLISRIIESVKN